MNEITKITIYNIDNGIEKTPIRSVYVDEPPFVCLANMMTRFYICSYNGKDLFHLYLSKIKCCVGIEYIGDTTTHDLFMLPRYSSIDLALYDIWEFSKCSIIHDEAFNNEEGESRKEEYLQFLAKAKEEMEDVQAVIDYGDILSLSNDLFKKDKNINTAEIETYIQQNGYNKYTMQLLGFVFTKLGTKLYKGE